jgi:hypothetical protein
VSRERVREGKIVNFSEVSFRRFYDEVVEYRIFMAYTHIHTYTRAHTPTLSVSLLKYFKAAKRKRA